MYRAVIFDIDGTLVDSNDAHAQAWVQAFAESGRHVEFSRVRPLIGKGGDKLLPEVAGISIDSPEGQALATRRREILQRAFLPHLKPTRGAHALLERLRDDRMKLVVATSADASEVQELLRVAGGSKLIESATSSDDAARSKPDPDIVRAALHETGCPASDVIMIGDTPYDVKAALRAGLQIIALRSGGWSDADLKGAMAIYDDPADLLEHYDRSPFKRPASVRSA
jgi:HAD superfamily hydrolase (TIGR01509 family)